MGKIKDLTGQKFGSLTVIKDTGERKNRQVVWECECDCENHPHIKVVGQALRSGHTTSCGCSRKGKNVIDLTGQKFGFLTVIKQTKVDSQRKAWWLCECECGNTREVSGTELRAGSVINCNKCAKENITYNLKTYDKINFKKFGKLLAIEPTQKRDNAGHILWRCVCECGNECFVSSNRLLTQNTTSCGCRSNSSGEENIKNILIDNQIKFIRQFTFEDCKSPKDSKLIFDFAILNNDNKIIELIEYDGVQHFTPVDFFGGEESFKYLQKCDNIKNQYCQNNNIKLLRISYKEKDNLENIVLNSLKEL